MKSSRIRLADVFDCAASSQIFLFFFFVVVVHRTCDEWLKWFEPETKVTFLCEFFFSRLFVDTFFLSFSLHFCRFIVLSRNSSSRQSQQQQPATSVLSIGATVNEWMHVFLIVRVWLLFSPSFSLARAHFSLMLRFVFV